MSTVKNNTEVYEDFKINVKLKISALWVAVMFCYVYGDYIQIYVPGILADAMAVKVTAETQLEFFAVALLMAMPSVMIFFTLVVQPKINRWLNIILSTLYIVILIATNLTETWVFYLFLTAIEVLISLAIIWYAWKWPKAEIPLASNV
ncbi:MULTISPECIES: DUF6326 family protein [unclassified Colwellia]|jgi:hypothetical protein|uniref:DUF6326 family protein n=1 Tax=unclassified Colwellia TaxID=196834 RepID=UPI0015F77457|nr:MULTISPECIES: DUF6326 family protein [unclassified Colwellia]MBA6338631.1 hypothetical protein [Colwellia sp. BRX8-7]MBA6354191.1 hypothetical protein [Colwellia sp. BRX9-1]MBA6355665.1 hypothetical protein [Colwellia sp. BRX8-3]MBA6361466.1 hypothetical protein [Colwellia sp. BRX8-6]MBA6367184.1 hypothetical protein [Colwellia sp. BRX8-5]